MDDVLAALDVHTAKWVVNEAFKGDLMAGRTILLVTHNLALGATVAEHVLVLGKHGKVAMHGPVSEVLQKDVHLREQMEKEKREIDEDIETKLEEEDTKGDAKAKATDTEDKTSAGKLVVAEEKAMGRVKLSAIMLYVNAVGGAFVWFSVVGIRWLGIAIMLFQSWFLGYWSNQYNIHPPSEVPTYK